MFVNFQLPEKVAAAIKGLKPYKRDKILGIIAEKTNLLFIENSHNLYYDMQDYTSFDTFIASFSILDNNGSELNLFYDEQIIDNDILNDKFENNLFGGEIFTKQYDYIDKFDKLKIDVLSNIDKYFINQFWKDFDKGVK